MPRHDLPQSYADDLLPLDELLEIYKRDRPLNEGTRTYGEYENSLDRFASYLGRADRDVPRVRDLSGDRLNEFLSNGSVKVAEYSARSKKSHASNIRSLVAGCRQLRLVPRDTLIDYELPKVPKLLPHWFSDAEVALLFDHLDGDRTSSRLRLRAMANITLDNGARPDEVVRIRICDPRSSPGELRIMGKGARERIVPLGESTLAYIEDYKRVRGPWTHLDEPLFLDLRDPRKGIDATTLSNDFADVLRATGLKAPQGADEEASNTFYSLRRTFARRSAEGGMDVALLASIMGHSANSVPMLMEHYYTPTRKHKLLGHGLARPADGLHEWRHQVRPDDRPLSVPLFARPDGRGPRIGEGNRRISVPPSAKRWSGE